MTNSEVERMIEEKVAAKIANQQGTIPSPYALDAWYSACMAGVFDGSNPKAFPTREQIAVVLNRLGEFPQLKCPADADFSTVIPGKFADTLGKK